MTSNENREQIRQADIPTKARRARGLPLPRICLFAFLIAMVWTGLAIEVNVVWFRLVNVLLPHGEHTFANQPLWGKIFLCFVVFSPSIGILACLIRWGVKERRWLVLLAFFLGIVAFHVLSVLPYFLVPRN